MTKKKPSPQNRIWEKERRDRLNQTFDGLSKLLPDYEPATQLSKIEILQRTIEYVEKLQNKIKAFLEERDVFLKKHVDELEERLQALIARNEDLAALLKKANITVPPCKHGSTGIKDGSQDTSIDVPEIAKKSSKPNKKTSPKKKDKEKKIDQQSEPIVPPINSVIEQQATISDGTSASTTDAVTSGSPETSDSSVTSSVLDTRKHDSNNEAKIATTVTMSTCIPSTCFVMANNQIVGTLKQTNGVNVTPTLLSTPIMATGVLISNNGSVLQMPLVPPQSSLLIVSNEDVRFKICLKKKSDSAKSQSKAKHLQNSKFSIKSIDVIPGRIINGKIPIPPLKRACRTLVKLRKEPRKKRRKRKITDTKEREELNDKKMKLESGTQTKEEKVANCTQQEVTEESQPIVTSISENVRLQTAAQLTASETTIEEGANSLDMNLDQTDLSNDLFANLQVPDADSGENQGSLSPTAAYLMNFPLVASGGKIAGNQTFAPGDGEISDVVENDKKVTPLQTNDNNLLLDNFSSYFSSSVYGGLDGVVPVVSEPVTTAAVTSTNFSTIYQSIDSMLEHKTSCTKNTSDCRYNATSFTFTLTPTSSTVTTQSSFDYRHSSTSNYYYPTTVTTTKPIDEYGLLKPAIVSEFTFSLTSTTSSAPKTMQSQYTNSSIHSSTMTTPSYSTYDYQSKIANKAASYTANYIPETPKPDMKTPKKYDFLEAEKPATSFTFSLTSTTKTLPKYTQSSIATPSTACVMQNAVTSISSSYSKVEDCLYKIAKSTTHPYKNPPKQKLLQTYPTATSSHITYQSQPSSCQQSKYDVNWMASQDPKPNTNQECAQLLPGLDINPTSSHSFQTANIDLSRKSDIFFAHPSTGEENLVAWSPNKLTNILNDTTSSYYPPTTVSLPNLNGDLALNSIINNCPPVTTTKFSGQTRKVNDTGSSFLSVQQLVDQPRKSTNKNYFNCTSYPNNQKPLQNNYSAEALIAAPSNSASKKDKLLHETSYNSYGTYNADTNATTGLSFNFDYSTDYNKNYNYNCQQNYMTSFMDNSYGLPTLPAVATSSTSSTNYSSYGYSSEKKQTSSYYQTSSYQVAPSAEIPYYVPSSEKRATSSKSKKYSKQPQTNTDHSSHPTTTTTSSYFPAGILPPPPPPPNLQDDTHCYNNFNFNPSVTAKSASCYTQPYQNAAVPNYSFGSGTGPYPMHAGGNNTVTAGSSLTNFNLSTICPEINEKSAENNTGGLQPAAIGTTVRQAITGGSGW
ncbi:mucin-5AC-like [Malaya genurostris]|uniref:mucin-5AC-like n=1 Tax=Malaya genurostris TaxID=325434 RepID=UPI0026F3806B|nr:mucin-5AC-like [Malaya genurostris]